MSVLMRLCRQERLLARRENGIPLVCGVLATLLAGCLQRPANQPQSVAETSEQRIRYYADRIAEHPRVYATYLGLAQAYLDKARETHEPRWLAKARAATQTSTDIQMSLEGYKMEARIAGFRHRFAEQLDRCHRAAELLSADVGDGEVTSLCVEALMGLGQYDEARSLLPADGAAPPDFHTAAAMGHWFASQQRRTDAAAAFETASRLAAAQGARPLAAWARVMAAGVYLDSGQPAAARPHLQAAAAIDPGNRELRIHEAELMVAEAHERNAIKRYEELLAAAHDAELHHRVFRLARDRGDEGRARKHFEAAERLLLAVVEAGEAYTLEELARLYLDAKVNTDRAVELATMNLELKRDRSAFETLREARRAAGEGDAAAARAAK